MYSFSQGAFWAFWREGFGDPRIRILESSWTVNNGSRVGYPHVYREATDMTEKRPSGKKRKAKPKEFGRVSSLIPEGRPGRTPEEELRQRLADAEWVDFSGPPSSWRPCQEE